MRAVSSVKEIAKAMEVVAATKMRRSQEIALKTRPYAFAALSLLERLARYSPVEHFLTEERPEGKTLLVAIASDRGFAGKFNAEIIAKFEKYFVEHPKAEIVALGKKFENHLRRRKIDIAKTFRGFGDYVASKEIEPLFNFIAEGYRIGRWRRVLVISTHFRTALRQEVLSRDLLPLHVDKIRETLKELIPETGKFSDFRNGYENGGNKEIEYIFEPTPKEAIEELMPHLLEMQIYHLVLEANASEHSARRVAMKNASDNATELSGELLISYNKTRQSLITNELIEITGTQSALA